MVERHAPDQPEPTSDAAETSDRRREANQSVDVEELSDRVYRLMVDEARLERARMGRK